MCIVLYIHVSNDLSKRFHLQKEYVIMKDCWLQTLQWGINIDLYFFKQLTSHAICDSTGWYYLTIVFIYMYIFDLTGWYGLIIVFVIATTMAYTGILLGRCWIILQERFECYRHQTRYPFAAIGYESFGPVGRQVKLLLIYSILFNAIKYWR